MTAIQEAMTTAFTQVQTDVMASITSSLPIALGIVGTVLAITIGLGVFKKITARA